MDYRVLFRPGAEQHGNSIGLPLDIAWTVAQHDRTMKSVTVCALRNEFPRLARWIEDGEWVEITRSGKPFAHLAPIPPPAAKPVSMPDFLARIRENIPKERQAGRRRRMGVVVVRKRRTNWRSWRPQPALPAATNTMPRRSGGGAVRRIHAPQTRRSRSRCRADRGHRPRHPAARTWALECPVAAAFWHSPGTHFRPAPRSCKTDSGSSMPPS